MSRRWLSVIATRRPGGLPVFRPLPLACATMVLLLGVKTREVVHALGGAPAALLSAGRAMVPAAAAAAHEAAPSAPAKPAESHAPAHSDAAPGARTGASGAAPAAPVSSVPPVPTEPPISESERALLLDLRARRGQIEVREQALATRDSVAAAAEKRIGERVEQLQALQAKLEAMEAARRERDDANWRGLVKTYEVMRPRDAAAILNELEMPVLLQVLDRMKESKAAVLLAAMLPDRARTATAQLAAMRTRSIAPPVLPDAVPPPAAPRPAASPGTAAGTPAAAGAAG
ncbi:MAG: MotE family protein [Janthinobacterium lividum]